MTGQDKMPRGVRFVPAVGALVIVGLALCVAHRVGPAQEQDPAQEQASKAVTAAKKFLESLDDKLRARVVLDLDSPMRKKGWSNLPVSMVPRSGVAMGELTKAQRDAALGLLAAVLSAEGYQKVIDIMNADEALEKGGGGKGGKGKKGGKGGGKKGGIVFGNDTYHLAVFGTPSLTQPWYVQFGGHHLGLNVTLVGKAAVLEPTHTGAQPEKFTRDGKTVRPLGAENDKAFALVNALDDKQKAQAILGQKPINLQAPPPPAPENKKVEPKGVKAATFTDAQKAMLLDLIGQWIHILPGSTSAKARMAEIKAKLDDTYFAWYGPTTNGSAIYFRVQGPTLVIEYAPQGSTDHIHTILRDPTDDYGVKLQKR
jgi:hypothetical protein